MLPSCGFFRNIPCPFFKLALCVRPHCPYKHQAQDNISAGQALPQLVDGSDSFLASSSASSSDIQRTANYVPTPVDSKPAGILKSKSSVPDKPASVPVYRPTPISQLKESISLVTKSNKAEYKPEFAATVRRKKNVEEYDPTEVRCVPKKSVTFVDPSDSEVILISSEEEELDDSGVAPAFSDDDDDLEEDSPEGSVHQKQLLEAQTFEVTVQPTRDDEIELIEVNEFSVVDKILVDSKNNELLLKAKQSSHLRVKSNESASKASLDRKVGKTKPGLNELAAVKAKKETKKALIEAKTEKNAVHASNVKDGQSAKISTVKDGQSIKISTVKDGQSNKISTVKDGQSNKNSTGKDGHSNKISTVKDGQSNKIKVKKNESGKKEVKQHSQKESKISSSKKDKSNSNKEEKSHKSEKHTKKKEKLSSEQAQKKEKFKDSKGHESKLKTSSKKSVDCDKTLPSNKTSKLDTQNHLHSSSKNTSKKRVHEEPGTKLKSADNGQSSKRSKNIQESPLANDFDSSKTKGKVSHKSKHSHSSKRKIDSLQHEHEESPPESSSPAHKKAKTGAKSMSKVKAKSTKDSSDSESDVGLTGDVDFSDSDLDEECRRIYNEFYPESTSPKGEVASKRDAANSSDDIVILRKKRLAHPAAVELKKPGVSDKIHVKRQPNPAQIMLNRFAQVQAKFAKSNGSQNPANDVASRGSDKKKLNFVPNHSLLAAIKHKNDDNASNSKYSPHLPTGVSTTLKVSHRVAHVPEAAMTPRPIIPADFSSKVPSNVRQKFLNAFIDECLKFLPTESEAYDHAMEEEKKAFSRSSSKALYMNVAANTLKRLRNLVKEVLEKSTSASSQNVSKKTVSHETVLNGPLAQRTSFSVAPKKKSFDIKELSKTDLYEHLLQYVLTLEQLKENGFPLQHPTEKERAIIEGIYANRTSYCNDAFKRVCCRCQKPYYVNVDGDYVRDEECDFHWGRIWKKRIAGTLESRYSCCQGDAESDGCCVSQGHVFEGSEHHALRGFVKTLKKAPPEDNFHGIYALDCEMCYTTAGMELTRVTVIDTDLKPVYESFVKPQHKVLDFNTRFSGITEDDLKNVRTSLHDVQAVLLCIFNDRTILIGHSLESDFKALKLFHRTVVDTSVVFPHKNGLPFKRALRTLTAEKLNKIIQNDVGGHDSHEDAAACMELMLWKVKEDLRGNR